MRHSFHPVRFGLISLLSLAIALGSAHLSQAQTNPLLNTVQSCLPTQTRPQIVRTETIAQTQAQGKTFYLLAAYPASGNEIDLVISVAGGQCRQEFFNPTGEVVSLTQVLGQDIARQLALGRYQREIDRGGKSKLQQEINRAATAANGLFYPEEVWALRQLGLSVPTTVQVKE